MIGEVKAYTAECDICGEMFESPCEGFSIFADQNYLQDVMSSDGWHIGDGDQGEEGKCYCDKCHYIDDDDNFHIINREEK